MTCRTKRDEDCSGFNVIFFDMFFDIIRNIWRRRWFGGQSMSEIFLED
ncbi:hypothetical protein RLEG3_32955 [Rhizobium leguminosarum bv. trifolii WSM1689]|nr:hypothetical protein RLEG3_32955 [Rhizobium leguminosarum bv. trifolii WSM1689]